MTDHPPNGETLINDVERGHVVRGTLRDAISDMWLLNDLPRPPWDVFVPALLQHTEGGRS